MMYFTRFLAVAALPFVLVSCSSSTTTATNVASSAAVTSSAVASSTVTDPNSGLLNGTQLKAALAPATFFGAGFAIQADGTRDTGVGYQIPADANLAKPDCTVLGTTSWERITGVSGVSFAQNDYLDKSSGEVAQQIDVYQGTTSTKIIGALGKISVFCPKYTDSQTSSTVKVSEQAVSGLGDAAYKITLSDSAWQNKTTLVAARVGTAVVTVMSTTASSDASKLTATIVAALKGKA
jgi:hypothetical protein